MTIDTKELRRQALAADADENGLIEVSRIVVLNLLDHIDELESQAKHIDLDPSKDRWYP